jgi:selenocysteine lyase/cysteine desulfurase
LNTVGVDHRGAIDLDAIETALRAGNGGIGLVSISGASNVTGVTAPVHDIAALAHRYGARILVDAAQLVAHRRIDCRAASDPGHLDFVVLSGHKMYAPYGAGVLIAARDLLVGQPSLVGGGAVDLVTLDETLWSAPPDNHEAGSPNVPGAIALSVAGRWLEDVGFDAVDDHEGRLRSALLAGFGDIPGVSILGCDDPAVDALGVVSFTVAGLHHAHVAAALSWEWAVGVRHGCFCAHPYLLQLMGLPTDEIERARDDIRRGDWRNIPGAVRASVGAYSTRADVDRLLEGVTAIARGDIRDSYVQDAHGNFDPEHGAAIPTIYDLIRSGGAQIE